MFDDLKELVMDILTICLGLCLMLTLPAVVAVLIIWTYESIGKAAGFIG